MMETLGLALLVLLFLIAVAKSTGTYNAIEATKGPAPTKRDAAANSAQGCNYYLSWIMIIIALIVLFGGIGIGSLSMAVLGGY